MDETEEANVSCEEAKNEIQEMKKEETDEKSMLKVYKEDREEEEEEAEKDIEKTKDKVIVETKKYGRSS